MIYLVNDLSLIDSENKNAEQTPTTRTLRAELFITSFFFWASSSASLCRSSSSSICFSMIFLASSTRLRTSASISSLRLSSSSSTRLATSSSTLLATSSSINFSSSSFCRLLKTTQQILRIVKPYFFQCNISSVSFYDYWALFSFFTVQLHIFVYL